MKWVTGLIGLCGWIAFITFFGWAWAAVLLIGLFVVALLILQMERL